MKHEDEDLEMWGLFSPDGEKFMITYNDLSRNEALAEGWIDNLNRKSTKEQLNKALTQLAMRHFDRSEAIEAVTDNLNEWLEECEANIKMLPGASEHIFFLRKMQFYMATLLEILEQSGESVESPIMTEIFKL